jgi:uncharacterized protein (TIGR02246 family)
MMTRWLLVAAWCLAPSQPPSFAQPALTQSSRKSARVADGRIADEIVRLRTEWAKNLRAKQLDQIAALYAPDAVYLLPSGARVTGRPAIRDICKKIMDNFTSEITFQSRASDHSGDLAYDSGEYRESLVKLSDQTKAEVQGNYVMIFRRQPDGTWLIAEQMWTLVTPGSE